MSPESSNPEGEFLLQNPEISKHSLNYGKWLANAAAGEEVVISGLAGSFPESENIYELRDNLFNKVDMVTDDSRRWHTNHPEIPQRTGKLKNLTKFDAGFFGIHYRQVQTMDPMLRVFLEKSVEAILDAGLHPSELEGSNTGVFLGSCFSESEKHSFYQNLYPQNFGITGCTRSMIANRVSYYLKLKGPSFILDTACSSSMYALENAFRSIRNGQCDSALVGGTQVCLHPVASLQFSRLGVLSIDGSCKVFDQNANGYARAETVACIFLQKSKNARRIYGKVIYAKINCDGYKEQGITFPSSDSQRKLLEEFYQECTISPYDLTFLEAHGTGTQVGDPEEIMAIDEVFTKGRTTPLFLGSVKSNMGHTEPSAGMCSISKVIIAMETGFVPPNINFNKPKDGMTGLEQGRMKVITEKTPFPDNRGLIGINSFGFGGGNCHVLIQWNTKEKMNQGQPSDDLPRIICVSGRLKKSIIAFLNDVSSKVLDAEYVRLLHQIFSKDFPTHLYRGYSIVSKFGEISRSFKQCQNKPYLYLSFNSFGTNLQNVGKGLYDIPLFAKSIQKMQQILIKEEIDILEIILGKDQNEVLGTIAIHIGLIDILGELEIGIEGYFGNSYNELACAYLDGSLNLEEAILSAYKISLFLGKSLMESHKNCKYSKAKKKLPNGNLTKTNNEAEILQNLSNIIGKNKRKGAKWLSNKQKYVTSQYFVDNLKNARNHILNLPKNSIVMQLGCCYKPKKVETLFFDEATNKNVLVNFLEIIGSLYEHGQNPQIDRLYPKIQYPVSRGTPMISPLIKWNHKNDWFLCYFKTHESLNVGEKIFDVTYKDPNYLYMAGHIIDGRNLFPATGYLNLAWITLAQSIEMIPTDFPVVFENCKFLRATALPKETIMELTVMVQKGTGNFEIIESNSPIVTGRIFIPKDVKQYQTNLPLPVPILAEDALPLQQKDIYKELRLRGYNYKGKFKGLKECDNGASVGSIKWEDNWVTFMDSMMQMKILQVDTRLLYVPTSIQQLSIDPKKHFATLHGLNEEPCLPVHIYNHCQIIKSGGIEISGLQANSIGKKRQLGEPVLEKYEFIPNHTKISTLNQSVRIIMQVILENALEIRVKGIELIDEATQANSEPLSPLILQILGDLPLIQPDITIFSKSPIVDCQIKIEDKKLISEKDCLLVIGTNILQRILVLQQAISALGKNGFVISRESPDFAIEKNDDLDIFLVHTTINESLVLFRKPAEYKEPKFINVSNMENFNWLPELQFAIKNDANNIVMVAQNCPMNGIMGLVNCLRREPGGSNVKCIFIIGEAPKFDASNDFYKKQIKKNCAISVYKNSKWGTFRHLLLDNLNQIESEHCYANVLVRGDLSTLSWIEGATVTNGCKIPEKELIYVYYTALNFRDIMTASGRINADVITMNRLEQECVQGFEFTGRNSKGERVMAMAASGALSTLIVSDSYFSWPIPNHWSLEEAATVPVVYGTVLYSILVRGNLKRGNSILIHAGSGGIGQAAIRVALYYGCTIFTTVGTQEKCDALKKLYPQLKDSHIGNSRDTTFEQMIQIETNGRGVDIVINSLAEEKLIASVRCLAKRGRFLEIGKFDLASNNPLKLLLLKKEASFHGIMLDQLFTESPAVKQQLRELFTEGLQNGSVKPLPRTIFKMDELEQAFRYMASGKHIGKVLINIRKEEQEKVFVPKKQLMKCIPRYYCDPKKTYIITGGLGGFGLELADWLILRGARKIVLTSRNGIKTGYQSMRIRVWKSYGVLLHISTANITTKKGCTKLIEEANKIGMVDAIFHLAVILKDCLLENQCIENFITSFEPKANAAKYLDLTTRKFCPKLRNFVVFSSVSCGRGNAGQTNYGMANSVMERICEKRKTDGFTALAIEWGAIGQVGLVAEMQEEQTEIEIGGTLQQRISSCLDVLDKFLYQNNPIVSSMVVAEKRAGSGGADNIVDAVANILGIRDLKTVSLHSTLAELGMDSMTAVEIKQTLEREFEVYLTAQDIRSMTFARLYEIQQEKESENGMSSEEKKKQRMLDGMEMLVRRMPNETTCRIPVIEMDSHLSKESTSYPIILAFPGFEGIISVLQPLIENINAKVVGYQFQYDNPEESIQEMAQTALSKLEKYIKKKQFNIICYSFGTIVALELSYILEQRGYSGNIFIIDGAHEMLKDLLKRNLSNQPALFETGVLCQLMASYVPVEVITQNKESLIKCKNFEERMELAQKLGPKDTPYSPFFQRQVATALLKRARALNKYEPSFNKIQSPMKLFKPQFTSMSGIADDYKLSEISANSVPVEVFYGNHVTILENIQLANAINGSLGVDLIECEDPKSDISKDSFDTPTK